MIIITIGRSSDNEIVIADPSQTVSSYHGEIILDDNDSIYYADKSSNGTMVNGTIIHKMQVLVKRVDKIVFPNNIILNWNQIPVNQNNSSFKHVITVGKESNNQIRISGEKISRQHATIKIDRKGMIFIFDQSLNGTYVNGIRIPKYTNYPVQRNSKISFANAATLNWDLLPKKTTFIWVYIGVLIPVILLVLILSGLINIRKILPPNEPPKPTNLIYTPEQIADRSTAATVIIYSAFSATVSVDDIGANESAINQLKQDLQSEIDAGNLQISEVPNRTIEEIIKNPAKYLTKSNNKINKDISYEAVGSGFIISSDGYVVTNCHVIDAEDEAQKKIILEGALKQLLIDQINGIKAYILSSTELSKDEFDTFLEWMKTYYSENMVITNTQASYKVIYAENSSGNKIEPHEVTANVITKGSPIPGKDVAILKMEESSNYPTLEIGEDRSVNRGSNIYILGYPAAATYNQAFSSNSIIQSTLTRGIISAKKTMKDGWDVLQTDASISAGNSGGPAFDEHGKVIGLATFAAVDPESGLAVSGENFIVSVTIVKEFLAKINITPTMSNASLTFNDGLNYFEQSNYDSALVKFEQAKQLNSGYPYVDKWISESRQSIK